MPPHAVLLDIGLPGCDGYDLYHQLREHEATKATPIIALTGYAFGDDLQRAREAGCTAVLTKPCPPPEIIRELQHVLPESLFQSIA